MASLRITDRLEVLRRKLEDEGSYVGANTAALASDALDLLRRVEWCVLRTKITTSGRQHVEASALLDEMRTVLANPSPPPGANHAP